METKPHQALSFDNTVNAFSYKSDKELRSAHRLFQMMNNNTIASIGTTLTPLAIKLKLPIKSLVKSTIYNQFCGGETLSECAVTVNRLGKYNVQTALDYGVEGKQTDEDFDKTTGEYLRAIEFARDNAHVTLISLKVTGQARFALLEKISKNLSLAENDLMEWNRVKGRLHRVCKKASECGMSVMVDAEETWIQHAIDLLVEEMSRFYNKERAVIFNTVQLYRHEGLSLLKNYYENAKRDGYVLGIKMVRGAYMQKERERAQKMNYPSPIHKDKTSCDKDYNLAIEFCIENVHGIHACIASHNEESNMLAVQQMQKKGLPHDHPHIHFSQLLGMSDHITFNLANEGYNASKYVPYGPVEDVIPYLMRRAKENTSVQGQTSRELTLIRKELKRRKK